MWVFSKFGYYSIINLEGRWAVRARKELDLTNLLRELSWNKEILKGVGTDYEYRIFVDQQELSELFNLLSNSIDYDDFKKTISGIDGQLDKLQYLHKVWNTMWDYQQTRKELTDLD